MAGRLFWERKGRRPAQTSDRIYGPPSHGPGPFPGTQGGSKELGGEKGGDPRLRRPDLPCFPAGGLCNLCSDGANREHILQTGGIPLIINCLSSPNEETVLSAVTTMMYLSSPGPGSHPELTAMPVVQCMLRFSLSANTRLRNLAQIFLEDFCSPSQVADARRRPAHSALGIPLPKTEAPQQP